MPQPIPVSNDEMMAVLNERASGDPLVREILRSSMYEAVLRRSLAAPPEPPEEEEVPDELPTD